jgi:hypothetical protein
MRDHKNLTSLVISPAAALRAPAGSGEGVVMGDVSGRTQKPASLDNGIVIRLRKFLPDIAYA